LCVGLDIGPDRLLLDIGARLRDVELVGLGVLVLGAVEQLALHRLLRTGVAPLAHAGALADASAQVVQLRAPDVSAGGHLDALDLR
jgi:hypothetical protein